jgi:cell shape-determining protein MreC
MSAEQTRQDAPKNRTLEFLAYIVIAVAAFGAGMLIASKRAEQDAATVEQAHQQEVKTYEENLKNANSKAEQDKQALTDSLAKEREQHAKDMQANDRHLAAVSSNTAGVRRALEASLSAARSSGDACTARIAGISEALGGIFDSIGEVTGLAQDLGRENQQLKEDNRSLADKLAGWQKWNAEQMQRITVIGKKSD